ncbi:MAG: hypothetical protein ACRCWW_08750 [Scandinavium sp.]|uniref:hypothetical protein n=1 Tax=Scandinavium sp. TaxID=2830653 RepID=UPI003F3B2D26
MLNRLTGRKQGNPNNRFQLHIGVMAMSHDNSVKKIEDAVFTTKVSLRDNVPAGQYPLTWLDARNAFQRVSFNSIDDISLCTMLYQKLIMEEIPQCKHYQECLDAFTHFLYSTDEDKSQNNIIRQRAELATSIFESYNKIRSYLITEGFICVQTDNRIELGSKGITLKAQKNIPPVSRERANELLNKVKDRARMINGDDLSPYFVKSIHVYGSFLTEKLLLGDLDLAFELSRKGKVNESRDVIRKNELAFNKKHGVKDSLKAIYKILRINNSISLCEIESLKELIETGKAKSLCVYQLHLPE